MGRWTHTYREGQIPPGGTITGTRPGRTIAKAITEIQEKAVTDVDLQLSGNIQGQAEVNQGIMRIELAVPDTGDTGGGTDLPEDGEAGMVLTRGTASAGSDGWIYWDWVRAIDR